MRGTIARTPGAVTDLGAAWDSPMATISQIAKILDMLILSLKHHENWEMFICYTANVHIPAH